MTTSDNHLLVPDPPVHNATVAADESAEWVRALSGTGLVHDQAVARLHAMLVRACHRELHRRRGQLDISGPELEDLAYQAAADATMAVTAKISTFRGESRFTTWAYKFAIFEVSTKVGRHFWQKRTTPLDAEDWDRLPDRLGIDPAGQVQHQELLAAVRAAVETELSPRQRTVFVALVIEGVPLDALVERTGSNRNALYKSMFDARGKIRKSLVTNGYINDSDAPQGKETPS
ncbi:RNA polymerase sigma factor [Jatrophihabitans lederbergiae]|uniref:Sigma-70 family RNA polymerase sigma factor n=1 Tax=Jatrophihabitans lederbergiae TaxID=3075547 RepID=A0ABU2JG39_9ACTN|nr:sigma-70 family RNA polymerase sigma factor [Jatrophihabitans sp. DSM 44399]MDT0263967.1 sigma-70 family RNA polymerase sigma factor [Jatrophihabitans sp. DSM 44399]